MSDAKVKVSINDNTVELEGSEAFVEKHWEEVKSLLNEIQPEVQNKSRTNGKKSISRKKSNIKKTNTASKNTVEEKIEIKKDLQTLATKCNISLDELKETIAVHGNVIEIVKRTKIKEKEKHILCSLIILTAYRILAEKEWISSSTLKKCLDRSAVGDIIHLPRSLGNTPLINSTGTKKGRQYMVIGKGMDLAFEFIHKLAKNEEIKDPKLK